MSELQPYDVVVIGAGPAGVAAASRAAESGSRVLLVDEGETAGGQIWRRQSGRAFTKRAQPWLLRLGSSGAEIRPRTSVLDATADGALLAETDGELIRISTHKLILAPGARELFLPFPGWTLPRIVGVGAVQALLKSGARFNRLRVVLAGSGPLLLPVAAALAADGADLAAVAEQTPADAVRNFALSLWSRPEKVIDALRYRSRFMGCSYRMGTWITSATGADRVEEVRLTDGDRSWSEPCDLLCSSYGLVPNTELARWLGCRVESAGVVVDDLLQTSVSNIFCAGEATGIGGADLALIEGEIAGAAAVGDDRGVKRLRAKRKRWLRFAAAVTETFAPRPELRDRLTANTTVCRCEDVTWQDLNPEWSFRQAKLYTRVGMGPCQSRICGPALEFLNQWDEGSVRVPLKPCRLRSLASPTEQPSGVVVP